LKFTLSRAGVWTGLLVDANAPQAPTNLPKGFKVQKLISGIYQQIFSRITLFAVVFLLAIPGGDALATNGYFSHGMGTKNKGRAGAGMAQPDEAMSIVNNPAVATEVTGRSELGVGVLMPRSNYASSDSTQNGQNGSFTIGPNTLDAENQYLLVPYFASSWQLRDNSAFAVALYTRSGLNTEYRGGTATFDPDGAGPLPVVTQAGSLGDGDVKWKLFQTLLDVTYAQHQGERFSWGLSGVLAAQSCSAKGFGNLAPLTETWAASGGSVVPQNLSGNGTDRSYGAGVKLGAHWQWTPGLSLGAMYQTKIYMSEFNDYSDLLPDGGNFDIPANLKLGLSWRIVESFAFSMDVEQIFYTGVETFDNSLADLFTCPTAGHGGQISLRALGAPMEAAWAGIICGSTSGRGPSRDKWTFRRSVSATSPFPEELTNNLFTPYMNEAHYTLGFTRAFEDRELNFAFMYTEEESLHGPSAFDTTQELLSEADQLDVELSYGWRF
jgi:long-chain fatty acid transport protein